MSLKLDFNEERYVELLTNLIGETKYLQDKPPRYVPEEDRCAGNKRYIAIVQ